VYIFRLEDVARRRSRKLLQVKLFSVTSVLQDKIPKEKTVVERIRNLTEVDILLLNVTVMSHTLPAHFA
jgi:hypothetical protein